MILIKNRLNAGFFSNLNAVIGWYWYSMRTGIPIHVKWDGIPGGNIFNIFFKQKYDYVSHEYEHNANVQHSPLFTDQIKNAIKEDLGDEIVNKYDGWFFCQGVVYTEPDFYKIRQLYHHVYSENLTLRYEVPDQHHWNDKNILGVNYRFIHFYFTDDGVRTPFNTLMTTEEYNKKYLDQIEKSFDKGNYDKIYLASSHRLFFETCLDKFKDKLLYLPMKRVEESQTEYDRGVPLQDEFVGILTDVINLGRCNHLLISPSNLIFGTLYLNPNITYNVVDFLKQTHTS